MMTSYFTVKLKSTRFSVSRKCSSCKLMQILCGYYIFIESLAKKATITYYSDLYPWRLHQFRVYLMYHILFPQRYYPN